MLSTWQKVVVNVIIICVAFPVATVYYYQMENVYRDFRGFPGVMLILSGFWLFSAILHYVWEEWPRSQAITLSVLRVLWNKWVYGAILVVWPFLVLNYPPTKFSVAPFESLMMPWKVLLGIYLIRYVVWLWVTVDKLRKSS